MREAYRLQKHQLYSFLSEKKLRVALMLIFSGKQKPEFNGMQERVSLILQRLKESL